MPFVEPVLGFWLILAHPVYLLGTASVWRGTRAAERLGGSLCAVLLALMVGGLFLNAFLPVLGVARPLGRVPVLVLADAVIAVLCLLRRRYPPDGRWPAGLRPSGPSGPSSPSGAAARRLIAGSGLCVIVAVLGANRLNNGPAASSAWSRWAASWACWACCSGGGTGSGTG